MTLNPYESPSPDAAAVAANAGLRVDGRQLVVRSGVVLPPFCVKTNEPVTGRGFRQRKLSWCPPIVGLLILLSGPLLILVYFLARKRCMITFGLAPAIQRRYRNWLAIKLVSSLVLFFAIPLMTVFESTLPVLVACVLFIVAVVALFVGGSPVAITKHQNGEFWITGCSREFLARLQA